LLTPATRPDAYPAGVRTRRALPCCLLAALACAGTASLPAAAYASDATATSTYLQANYTFARTADAEIPAVERTLHSLRTRVGGECGEAAANSPQDTDSEQLSNEVIGTMVTTADRVNLAAGRTFVKAVRGLRWSSSTLTRQIAAYASHVSRMIALAVPKICEDIRSWAGSGFQTLPSSTIPFDTTFLANWVAPGDLPAALSRYETGAERALARRTVTLEERVTELEAREVETWGHIMNELGLYP
jgi:hypothetical protein